MAECFFCFSDGKLTRAHLFQTRFREAIDAHPGKHVYLSSASVDHGGINRSLAYPDDMRQVHVTALCRDCNSNWMQSIEIAAVPTFAEVVQGDRVPPPVAMLALAHWAVVLSALSSELYPALQIPKNQRREIRESPGLPYAYSTFFVWTSEYLRSIQLDLYRAVSAATHSQPDVHWSNLLHAGQAVMITATPDISGRIARVLTEASIHCVLGFIGPTLVYVPDGWSTAMTAGPRPTHQAVHDLAPIIFGGNRSFTSAPNGQDMLDLSAGLHVVDTEMSFDFAGHLFDYRQLKGSS
jgi:hypothetical protein